ncbi:MAG: hypothetical protein ACHQAY_17235 [Hyphomicrobiales bacterium]
MFHFTVIRLGAAVLSVLALVMNGGNTALAGPVDDAVASGNDPRYSRIVDPVERVFIYRLEQQMKAAGKSKLSDPEAKRLLRLLEGGGGEVAPAKYSSQNWVSPKSVPKAKSGGPAGAKLSSDTGSAPRADDSVFAVFLRHSFADVNLFTDPHDVASAQGAQISYTADRVSHNTNWATQGVGAVMYRFIPPYVPTNEAKFIGVAVGPYISVDRSLNSSVKLKTKNKDLVTLGGSGEVGYELGIGNDQYFQFRVASTTDQIKDDTNVSLTAAWLPVMDAPIKLHFPNFVPGTNIWYRLDPSVVVQVDSTTDKKSLLTFSRKEHSLRIGPQMAVWVAPFRDTVPVIEDVFVNFTYHLAYEAVGGRRFCLFVAAPKNKNYTHGYLGLTATYQHGMTEDTGDKTNLVKVSLTAKY